MVGKVLSDVREDIGSFSYGDVCCEAVLYDVQASFTIVVEHIRMTDQVSRDDALKRREAIVGMLEA